MKKVNALVIGIVFLFASMFPFTSAFADSDPGISTAAFNASFGWYTGFPMVDSYGYLDINDWTINYQSNGTPSSNPSSGDVVYLYQPGDFVEISFSNWDLLSSYTTPVWCVQFGQNPSYSGNLQDAKYTLYQSYNTSECFYQYNRSFSYDNREIKWAHCFFAYPGSGQTKIRVEYDGTPVIWNAIYIKFLGYRNEPNGSTYTQADLLQLQASISSTLNLAMLADALEMDSSDIDLSTLEATTASILQKLANVPDIIQYIDQIETIDNNILSAINTFYNFYVDLYKQTFRDINSGFIEANNNVYQISSSYERINTSEALISITATKLQPITIIRIYFGGYSSVVSVDEFEFYITNNGNYRFDPVYDYFFIDHYIYIITDNTNVLMGTLGTSQPVYNIRIKTYDNKLFSLYNRSGTSYFAISDMSINTNVGFFNAVILYLRSLAYGNGAIVPSGIQQTTDTVTEQVTDIVEFEDTYNTSLENSASQIDVSSYEIQQTQGMSFMRTYTELNFDRMQNFRILFLTPLILALAAFFLRRKT